MPARHRQPKLLLVAALVFALSGRITQAEAEADKTALAVEALSRLQGVDLNSNPKLKETVLKVLEKTRGTPSFVKLVRQFDLPGQNTGLLEVAVAQPVGETSIEAIRTILASDDLAPLQAALAGTNTLAATRLAEALGYIKGPQARELLLHVATQSTLEATLRKQTVRSLAQTPEGASALLKLAKAEKLSPDLKLTASTELNGVRWPEIKAEAASILPAAQGLNAQPLPPLAELLELKGNIANGARLFTNASPGCAACHVVHGSGTDFGPNLSQIGTKLGRDALLEAILEPSAGISFGFEAFNFTLKNGDEAYGLVASETAEEVTVKAVGGIVTRLKKTDIVTRQQSKLSIMPAGLQASMTPQELIDLVDYLSSLK